MAKPDCLFCKIVQKELPAEVVYEDDQILAIKDIDPAAPVHLLLIPKMHIASLNEIHNEHLELMGRLQMIASQLAKELGIAEKGYRLVNNCGSWGGQAIFHLHYHLLGGKEMGWPPE
ncbi:Histidine triad (HIT) protein [Syntrophomonas zehnderi OL-4]|uniref:Histidine triad (HIT) protein n=1 Tax=Syntrophomonas zehnderi OL-4 TaxID=690567 RepID=A0A0E4GCJ0_9FIRM|nr:histidine triad nucleotide-binding protein [Syntrophomonas zehnderi]CFX99237.1 Histidine triad (HIT) protein [Syntrophomonas zehnderi OL-4]